MCGQSKEDSDLFDWQQDPEQAIKIMSYKDEACGHIVGQKRPKQSLICINNDNALRIAQQYVASTKSLPAQWWYNIRTCNGRKLFPDTNQWTVDRLYPDRDQQA